MAESKPRVLLVEDTRSLAVVYEQYLAQDGYEVLRAGVASRHWRSC